MREVAVVGAASTKFGERFDVGYKDLLQELILNLLQSVDQGLSREQIQAVWVGQGSTVDGLPSAIVADYLGLLHAPVSRVESACASGTDAFRNGVLAVASGVFDVVLVIGAEKMRDARTDTFGWRWAYQTRDLVWDYPLAITGAANFALHMRRHMHEFGTTPEQMALVAVKNHRFGKQNPHAHFRFDVTVEQALASPMVSTPFRLLDCCPQTDGAAAVLLAGREVAGRFTDRPVVVKGLGLGQDRAMHAHKEDLSVFQATVRAAKQAYSMAGLGPKDIQVAECHDDFTGIELINYEDLGFCEKGQGGRMIESGATDLGGRIPVNPSGGLKSRGHPVGATGVAQIREIFRQLRGEADCQVDGARIGLTHTLGGPTATSGVTILARGF